MEETGSSGTNKSIEELSLERLTEIARFSQESHRLLANLPVLAALPLGVAAQMAAIAGPVIRIKCGSQFIITGADAAEGESSFDFRCNDQAEKEAEAKTAAEAEAKRKARDDASRQVQFIKCQDGCQLIVKTAEMTDKITNSLSIPKTDAVGGCYWKWKASAEAYLPVACSSGAAGDVAPVPS